MPVPSSATRATGSIAVVEKNSKVSLRTSAVNIEEAQAAAFVFLEQQNTIQLQLPVDLQKQLLIHHFLYVWLGRGQ